MHEGLHRAEIDDAALAGAQLRQEGLRDVEHAIQIDRQHVLPVLGDHVGIAGEGVAPRDAGIVHQHRDAADPGLDLGRHRPAGGAVGDVEGEGGRLAARFDDASGGRLRRPAIDVEHGDGCALARIAARDRLADAGAGTGDDGDVVLQQARHRISSPFC